MITFVISSHSVTCHLSFNALPSCFNIVIFVENISEQLCANIPVAALVQQGKLSKRLKVFGKVGHDGVKHPA